MFAFPAAIEGHTLSPLTCTPDLDRGGQQKLTKELVARWAIQTLVVPPVAVSGFQPAPFVIKVVVASASTPTFTPAQPAEFVGFRQFAWEAGDAKGIAFSAEGVRSIRPKANE